jgi:DNA-binding CsgD family transcriptional regulator
MAGSPKKRAKRLGLDPLDEPGPGSSVARKRPDLAMEPHNKVSLSEANRQRVISALADGYPQAAIAKALGISAPTLRRLMVDDRALMNAVEAQRSFEEAELRDILMELARKGDTVAAIFLAKARHGWRDRDDGKAKEPVAGGGVLLVPGPIDFDTWSAAAAAQQAKFRTSDPESFGSAPTAPRPAKLPL